MDTYHIALFIHIVTLVVAASATAVTKLAVKRRIRARSVREALEWHQMLVSTSRAFPLCLVSFTASGAYMVSVLGTRVWTSGFVVAGLAGVILLLGSGTYLGVKGSALTQLLERLATASPDAPPPRLAPPPFVAPLPMINTGIAIAVVFDMVTEPTSIAVALGIVALGVAAGAVIARRQRPILSAAHGSSSPAARAA
jgi:hypothetical protein